MRIKVLAVEINHVKEGKKDYHLLDCSYKNLDFQGKVEGKKLVSFASPDVFNALKNAKPGDEFDVTKGEKTAAGHVPWIRCVVGGESSGTSDSAGAAGSVASGSGTVTSTGTTRGTPRSTYETPEERAKKQVYIVRQSSIANALQYFEINGRDAPIEKVLEIATKFEHFVFGNDPVKALMDMEDDVPL